MSKYSNFNFKNFNKFLRNMNKLELYTILSNINTDKNIQIKNNLSTESNFNKSESQGESITKLDQLENEIIKKEDDYNKIIEGFLDLINSNLEAVNDINNKLDRKQTGGGKFNLYKSYYNYQKYKYKYNILLKSIKKEM